MLTNGLEWQQEGLKGWEGDQGTVYKEREDNTEAEFIVEEEMTTQESD